MEVELDVLVSPSLIVLMVSVDVKQHLNKSFVLRAQELCGSRGGRPGLPVPNGPYGLCGRKATFKEGNTVPNFMVFCTPAFEDDLFVCTQTALTLCVYTAHTQATNLPLI